MEFTGSSLAGCALSVDFDDSIVFTTLFNAGLSPQEAEVWIGRELIGASSYELSNKFQISEPVATHAYRRAKTKVNYLGITKESLLAIEKEKSYLSKIKSRESCHS
jgi:hypothetical protein